MVEPISLVLYANGFMLFSGPFRPYEDETAKLFIQDLTDGYFPYELNSRFPEGVPFAVEDRRTVHFSNPIPAAFPGPGRALGGNPFKPGHGRAPAATFAKPATPGPFATETSARHGKNPCFCHLRLSFCWLVQVVFVG